MNNALPKPDNLTKLAKTRRDCIELFGAELRAVAHFYAPNVL